MKTVLTNEIDGFNVVIGIDRPALDAEATRAAIRAELEESAEYQAFLTQKSESKNALMAAWQTIQAKRLALLSQHAVYNIPLGVIDIDNLLKETVEYIAWEADQTDENWNLVAERKKQMESLAPNFMSIINTFLFNTQEYADWLALNQTLKESAQAAITAVEDKRRSLMETDAVYFEPRGAEKIISDEEADALQTQLDALSENEKLTVDSDIDPASAAAENDYRGGKYWSRSAEGVWTKTDITALGSEPPVDSIAEADLTADDWTEIREQLEQERIDAMTPEERQAEYDQQVAAAAATARQLRSEYEIQGIEADQALADAQAWYNDKVAELRAKYGIEI
jgi:phosphoribosyl-AMP cyclohydrolase